MIWVTSRQARLEALIVGALLCVLVSVFLLTGHQMTSAFDAAGLHNCVGNAPGSESCGRNIGAFFNRFETLTSLVQWLNFLPVLLGLMLASPAISDLEHGTFRLIWTQSISRGRWLLTKIGFGIVTAAVISGGLVLLWTWWRGPFDALQGRFESSGFNFEGTVPIAYTVFAFALCLSAGTLLRRTVPAAAISIVLFLGVRLSIENQLRPHFVAPRKLTWDALQDSPAGAMSKLRAGDWVLSEGMVDSAGKQISFDDPTWRSCMGDAVRDMGEGIQVGIQAGSRDAINACLHDHGFLNQIVYQPAHRFWLFQGIESAIFIGLSLVLLGLTTWWVRHRLT